MTASNVARLPAPDPPPNRKPKNTAAAAQETDAEDGFVTVEQCGVTLRVPIQGKMPVKALIAFRDRDELRGTELLLGPQQWETFIEQNPTIDDLNEMGAKIEKLVGN